MPTPATEPPLPVFVYGSLLDPAVLAAKSGRRGLGCRARPAVLDGWRRAMLRGTPYPTLLRDRAGRVGGLLLRLEGAPLLRLAAYEGRSYRLRRVVVRTRSGRLAALAWIADPLLAGPVGDFLARARS